MRIAYVGPLTLGMLEQHLAFDRDLPKSNSGFPLGSEIVLELIRRGHEISVINGCGPHTGLDVYHAPNCTVYLTPECVRTRTQFLTLFVKEVKWLKRAITQAGPDVVFAQWTNFHAYAGLASGIPTLVVSHDSPWRVAWMFRTVQTLIKAIYGQLFVFPRLDHVVAVSPHIVEDLRQLNGVKGDILMIPNGIEIGNKNQELGNRKEIRREATTIVCVSQAGRLKNTLALVKAFELLRERHPDWRLVMYGQGLRDGFATREQINKVLFDDADVFCSPSLEESFGMVFIEAMKQGVPCVGGEKSGAVPWVIGCEKVKKLGEGEQWNFDSAGGVVCDVTKPTKLAECLEKVMLDYELRKKLSENGVKRVVENFDIRHVVDLYEAELKKIAKERT